LSPKKQQQGPGWGVSRLSRGQIFGLEISFSPTIVRMYVIHQIESNHKPKLNHKPL